MRLGILFFIGTYIHTHTESQFRGVHHVLREQTKVRVIHMDIPAHWRHLLPGQLPTSLPPFLLPSFSPSLTLVVVLSLSFRTSFLLTFSLSPSSPYTHTHLSPFLSFLPPSHTPTHTHTPLSALLISPPTPPPPTHRTSRSG